MTREEIIDGLKFTVGMFLFDPLTGETLAEPRNNMDKITIDACKGAIELLEQKPILDKIKAEIEAKCCITVGRECDGAITLHDVFEILDKYKEESEDTE